MAWDKPLSLVVGFQQKPAEKAEVNEIRKQKWQSVAEWRVEGGVEGIKGPKTSNLLYVHWFIYSPLIYSQVLNHIMIYC